MALPNSTLVLRQTACKLSTGSTSRRLAAAGLRQLHSGGSPSASSSSRTSPLRSFASRFTQQPRFQQSTRNVYQTFNNQQSGSYAGANSREWWMRMLGTAGVTAAGFVGVSAFLNRETREGALPPFERDFLNKTFQYTGAGVAIIAGSAVLLHKNGVSLRMMSMNPWAFAGISLVGGIGSMMTLFACSPESTGIKHLAWAAFNGFQALTLSPLLFLQPALLARAGLYTAGLMGALSYVGATAKSDQFLYMGGPLLGGLVVVALSSLAPMVLPVTAMRTLAISEAVSLYGGLAVFGGFTLYDTQKILHHARLTQSGLMKADPLKESVSLELDFINIFVRMVSILAGQQSRRK